MTAHETAALRQRLESVPRAALTEAILVAAARVGGTGALLVAIAEQQNQQTVQQARRLRSLARTGTTR